MSKHEISRLLSILSALNPDTTPPEVAAELLFEMRPQLQRYLKEYEDGQAQLQRIFEAPPVINPENPLSEPHTLVIKMAREVFTDTDAISLMIWDDVKERYLIKESAGLSLHALQHYVSKQKRDDLVRYMKEPAILNLQTQEDFFGDVDTTLQQQYQLIITSPIRVTAEDHIRGLLCLYYQNLQEEELPVYLLEHVLMFTQQIASLVERNQLYSDIYQWEAHWNAFFEAAREVTFGTTKDSSKVLEKILYHAVQHITGDPNFRATLGMIHLYDPDTNSLRLESVYPSDRIHSLKGHKLDLNVGKIGIVGRAALAREPQRVGNARSDPDYIELDGYTHSKLAVPLFDDELYGVLSVESDRYDAFDHGDQTALVALGQIMMIAMRISDLHNLLQRLFAESHTFYDYSQMIFKSGLSRQMVAEKILDCGIRMTGSSYGTLHLLEENALELVAMWPSELEKIAPAELRHLHKDANSLISAAFRQGKPIWRKALELHEHLPPLEHDMHSAVAVPLLERDNHRIIGVMMLQHKKLDGLKLPHEMILKTLASFGTVAFYRLQEAEALKQASMVALMGAWGAEVARDINHQVFKIRWEISNLKNSYQTLAPDMIDRLDRIGAAAAALDFPGLPEPNSADRCEIDMLIQMEVEHPQYSGIEITNTLCCPEVEVAVHQQWLRRLLNHLILNSQNAYLENKGATAESPCRIHIRTEMQGHLVLLNVEDESGGIDPSIAPLLFNTPIMPNGDGSERPKGDLLLVEYIVEQYGGAVSFENYPGVGASFTLSLPVFKEGK